MIAGLVDGALVAFGLCVVMLSLSACSAVLDSMQIFGSPAAFYACTLGASALLAWIFEPLGVSVFRFLAGRRASK